MKKVSFLLIALAFFSQAFSQVSTTLDGSKSYDPDGTIVSYLWQQTNGPAQSVIDSATKVKTKVTFTVVGNYTFKLFVTDNQAATGTDTVQVKVLPANIRPHADAGPDQTLQIPGSTSMSIKNKPVQLVQVKTAQEEDSPTVFTATGLIPQKYDH